MMWVGAGGGAAEKEPEGCEGQPVPELKEACM